ncbi:ABC transporter substrate-binding protein [Micromonospora sp. NPDC023956]|uniref:ABC transporter substrate-binding protein n=1 Tax=Micromonospora sp. NPDC023956 TaxID=3155722 RepID=UPI0033DC09DF
MSPKTGALGRFRALKVSALVGVVALLATACSSSNGDGENQSNSSPGAAGADIVVGVGVINPDLDAFSATSPPRSFYAYPVWSLLTRVDTLGEGAKVVPGVAESWTRVNDLTWQFVLRKDLKFANGEPVDAAAVVYSTRFMLDPKNEASIRGKLGIIKKVEATDDHTIRFDMSAPEAILPRLLGAMPIVPPKEHAKVGSKAFNVKPIGTGAFMVEKFVPGKELVLVPNPNSGQGEAKPASITFKAIPEDAARVAALKAGDVDIITKVPIDAIKSLESSDYQIHDAVEPRTYALDLYTDSGPLTDVRVRRAIAQSLDLDALVKGVMGGKGDVGEGQLAPKFMSGYCQDVTRWPYDLAAANKLMTEAGVSGLKLKFQTSQGFILNDTLLAQAIGEMIGKLDAVESVEIVPMEFSNYLDVYYGRTQRADMFAWGMSSSPFVDASVQLERLVTGYPQHNIGYSNPTYDQWFDKLRAAEEGTPERQQAFCELSKIYKEDVPSVAVMTLPDIWASSDKIRDFTVDQAGNPAWELITKVKD